jgi:hypothetical protein
MDLLPLIATAVGAVIALSGTLLADVRRDRRQRDRDDERFRRETYVDFVLALNAAHNGLRDVGDSATPADDRRAAVNRAIAEAGLFAARERLLMTAPASLVEAGETTFARLIAIRTAITGGAKTRSQEYHDAYHPFAEALWRFRLAVRTDFRQQPFTPESVDHTSWSELEDCAFCGRAATH